MENSHRAHDLNSIDQLKRDAIRALNDALLTTEDDPSFASRKDQAQELHNDIQTVIDGTQPPDDGETILKVFEPANWAKLSLRCPVRLKSNIFLKRQYTFQLRLLIENLKASLAVLAVSGEFDDQLTWPPGDFSAQFGARRGFTQLNFGEAQLFRSDIANPRLAGDEAATRCCEVPLPEDWLRQSMADDSTCLYLSIQLI